MYLETTVKSAVHQVKSERLPYSFDLNPYRGCEHRCRYCFALYSHGYLGSGDFFSDIYVKKNVAERLEAFLRSRQRRDFILNLGGVTDSYQPAEAHYRLMPEIWKLLIRYRIPTVLSTKSDLLLRDFELVCELSTVAYVNIASTITTLDPTLAATLEPGASPPERRLRMLEHLSRAGVHTGLHAMPVIPLLTDTEENLSSLFEAVKRCGIDYLITDPLNLRGQTKEQFFAFLRKQFPKQYLSLVRLYQSGCLDQKYKQRMRARIQALYQKYDVSDSYHKPFSNAETTQLSLF